MSTSLSEVTSEASLLGSRLNPYIINVNTKYPKRDINFDIDYVDWIQQGVERIQHGDFVRQGFHIRSNVSVSDAALFEATMFNGRNGHVLNDRAVVVY
jgi:hypothetical protein